MSEILATELRTYDQHRDELLGKAEGKYVLVYGDDVVDVFDSQMDAINHGYRQFGNVAFLVKQIVRVETPMTFTSNLIAI